MGRWQPVPPCHLQIRGLLPCRYVISKFPIVGMSCRRGRLLPLLLGVHAAQSSRPPRPVPPLPLPPAASRATGAAIEVSVTLGGAWLLREHVLDARYIPSESMVPTLAVGDLLLLDKISLRLRPPARGEIVCFRPPPALIAMQPALGEASVCMVKRIVAVAGDEVRVAHGRLVINGRRVREPYVSDRMQYALSKRTVPPGHVFVLGDNRDSSMDSHVWGCLDMRLLLGRPLVRYWPIARLAGSSRFRAALAL